ncbi:MAG: hypothetical protein SGBAC_006823, partial [Bacillariaceae sp.]
RSRRGGGSSFGSSRRPAAPARRAAPPARPASTSTTTTPAPVQQSSGGGMLSGIGSTIAQGMAFGTGSAVAHRAVGAVAGSMGGGDGAAQPVEVAGDMQQQQQQQQQGLQGACANDKQMFFECLQVNRGDQQSCSFMYEQLQQCQRESTNMQFS